LNLGAFFGSETGLRLSAFLAITLVMAALEITAPRRAQAARRLRRWTVNFAMAALATGAVRLLVPLSAVGVALLCAARGWGLFNQLGTPALVAVPASVLLLDLAIYAQHLIFHKIPVLWRVHRMHHSDLAIDVSTAVRFHPAEIVLSMLIKMAVVALLGIPAVAVVAFEILLNGTALFNHANVDIPRRLDAFLRLFVVTPDMHRVHHSVVRAETDSNFGFNLSCWDRLFGTYRAQPAAGHERMQIGLARFRADADQGLVSLLVQPLK
jgi:sterol desaturase/sphingolipid hydroxylase (fatty acid hydroxylase superfamily)